MFEGQEEIRNKEYPHLKNRVWLNSSAFVPHSMSVVKAMQEMTDYFHLPILGKEAEDYFIKINEEFYQGAGLLLDTSPNNISMVINTAHGLNYPLHGIDWQKRDNVVTCELEFPTNYMPWKYVSKTKGVEFRSAGYDENFLVNDDDIINLIDENTKLVSLSLVQFNTGLRVDVKKIAKVAHEYGALVALDAIQACGAVEVFPEQMDVDFVSAGGPKYLMGPLGIGICYINPKVIETMEPPMQGTGNYDFSDHDWMARDKQYHVGAKRFQNGTIPPYCVAGLNAAFKMINSIGIKTVAKHNHSLINLLMDGFDDMGIYYITPRDSEKRGVLTHVRLDKSYNLQKIVDELEEKYRVTISTRFDGLRFSVHLYNTEEDIHKALKAFKEVINK